MQLWLIKEFPFRIQDRDNTMTQAVGEQKNLFLDSSGQNMEQKLKLTLQSHG